MYFVYYSSPVTSNTKKLAESVNRQGNFQAIVQPVGFNYPQDKTILFVPSYGGNNSFVVPPQVKEYLNKWGEERKLVCGVVATGNRNFGSNFCAGGAQVARKLNVPLLGTAELAGQPQEIDNIIKSIRVLGLV